MNLLHAKSPCCRGGVRRFGNRRRQCVLCHHTWRIRQKRRGRKRKRGSVLLAQQFLNHEIPSLRCLARLKGVGREYTRRKMKRSLDRYLITATPSYQLLQGREPLIMIADAMWHWIGREKWTVYVILLKSFHRDTAVIMPVLLHPGHENEAGWNRALKTVDENHLKRVVALVSDGVRTLVRQATGHGWYTQRCHFHLLASIQNYATTGPRSRNRIFASALMAMVKELITTQDEQRIFEITESLRALLIRLRSRGLRRVITGLLHDLPQFRTYLAYPKLNLPITSNAAESTVQRMRDLLYRTRGFNTVSSLQQWVRALFLVKPTVKCRGHKSTN